MYVNYRVDRQNLGYKVLKDKECGKKLVLMTDWMFLLIKNHSVYIKGKRIIVIFSLATVVWFSDCESVSAISLPLPPTPVVRVLPRYEQKFTIKVNRVIPNRKPIITFNTKTTDEVLISAYLTNPRLSSNPEVLKLLEDLRGGNWGLLGTAAFLGFMALVFSMVQSFMPQLVPPGLHNGNGIDPFQPPGGGVHRYPPHYNFFFPRRTSFADRPNGSQLMAKINKKSMLKELRQIAKNGISKGLQASNFLTNGQVDLTKCMDEVKRRASELGCKNFNCTLERFKLLATENGKLSVSQVREAITVLHGEMLGLYTNAEREDYGKNVGGIDFKVVGQGKYSNITHVEVKNPVSLAIEKKSKTSSDLVKQGERIANKLFKQQVKWCDPNFRAHFDNLNTDASFPQSPENTLGLVDEFDLPPVEKSILQTSIESSFPDNYTSSIIFINNHNNI